MFPPLKRPVRYVQGLRIFRRDLPFHNREGLAEWDFVLRGASSKRGVSAMIRAKNEAKGVLLCLESIYSVFDEIVFIDNGSTDDTLTLVEKFKAERDAAGKIKIFKYPFAIARCGREHDDTPPDSVHSLAYFYNWCLARCTQACFFKWDCDMILDPQKRDTFREFLRARSSWKYERWVFPAQTVYRAADGSYLLARDEVNDEMRLAPNHPMVYYVKIGNWEALRCKLLNTVRHYPEVCIFELKDVSEDEFDHWSDRDFTTDPRKQREWRNYNLVKEGKTGEDHFVKLPIEAIEGGSSDEVAS